MAGFGVDYVYLSIFILLILVRILVCIKHCCDRRWRSEDPSRPHGPISIQIVPYDGRTIGNPEERRELILTSVITKIVASSKDVRKNSVSSVKDLENGIVVDDSSAKEVISNVTEEKRVVDNTSGTATSNRASNSANHKESKSNSDCDRNEQSDSILIDTISDIITGVNEKLRTLSMNMNRQSSSIPKDNHSPNSCPICLETFTRGDEICMSRNELCQHSFHLECMVGWLMNHDSCPLCRQNYLNNSSHAV